MNASKRIEVATLVLLVGLALLACKKNEAKSRACAGVSTTSAEDCERCCKSQGSNGYQFVNGKCSCLGG